MQCKVTEIGSDTYRLSTFHPDFGIQFNQILIKDDEPFLMHTGFKSMFQATLAGVTSIMDPATLRWVGFSHFESDECGALNEWLGVAPHAQAVCSFVGVTVNVNDFADRAPRSLEDGEVLSNDCNLCHTIITQGAQGRTVSDLGGLAFKHPANIDGVWQTVPCSDCHLGD